jgi:hypothetical protein
MGGSPFDRLRRIVVGVAAELAFRRLLSARQVPYDTLGATPFTDPDRYDVALGGRRCDLKSFLIDQKESIRELRRRPAALLEAAALVPADQVEASEASGEDLYLFGFVYALVTRQRRDLEKALAASQPSYLLHPLPSAWTRPREWASLRPLSLKSEAPHPLVVELGGQAEDRQFRCEQLTLVPGKPAHPRLDFYTLAYLHTSLMPAGRVGVHSPRRGQAYLIGPGEWGNIWVYGLEIVLTGYLSRREFLRKSRALPPGSRVLQYSRTRTRNLAVPVAELRPLAELFEQAQQWESRQRDQP